MLYDKDIREPLFDFLEETYGKVRILEEKTIGKSRADVVMVTPESLYGIEIKSDADTYVRLGKQVKDYNLFYDYNYVAVGTSHALHVEEHIPEWWGIITVEQAETMVDFYILRRPAKNPEMNWKKKLSILWRPELAHIQELNGLHKYKEKSKLFVMGRILEKVPEETLQRQLCEELFERDYTAITEEIRKYRRKNRRKNEK
ncbi:MAG: sce7726 family protein [Lachnospiraceae bacterium]|nr:sce7726 family protein [Lachnospiraceae bacterium]